MLSAVLRREPGPPLLGCVFAIRFVGVRFGSEVLTSADALERLACCLTNAVVGVRQELDQRFAHPQRSAAGSANGRHSDFRSIVFELRLQSGVVETVHLLGEKLSG